MKYRLGEEVVKAFRWDGDVAALIAFGKEVSLPKMDISLLDKSLSMTFHTEPVLISSGEWIVKDSQGECTIVNPTIFPSMYQPLDESVTQGKSFDFENKPIPYLGGITD